MGKLKNATTPILIEMFENGRGTKMNIWVRCKDEVPSWETFKRAFSWLIADKSVERTFGIMGKSEEIQVFDLTKKGKEVSSWFNAGLNKQ
tara:strand:- start:2591 stop:2860 length:270 start_codon:yes stop_codon:yes gene_type:complete